MVKLKNDGPRSIRPFKRVTSAEPLPIVARSAVCVLYLLRHLVHRIAEPGEVRMIVRQHVNA